MIISHKHKYLFIEVPHTGTTAISQVLREHYAGEKILGKHSNYSEFRKQATCDELEYFVFAGVRNPLDVVVTDFFKYRSNHKGAYTDREGRGRWVTPEHEERFRYVAENGDFDTFLHKFYKSVYNNWFLIGHRRFNYVMRFENLEADFSKVLEQLEIQPTEPLPITNKSARPREYADMYKQESIRFAAKVFGPFMLEWGYAFPESWGAVKVPLKSRLAFRAKDSLATLGARYLTLSGQSRSVQWAQRLVDAVT